MSYRGNDTSLLPLDSPSPYSYLMLLGITQEALTQRSLQPCSVISEDSSTATMALSEQDQHHLSPDSSVPARRYGSCWSM